MKRKTKVTMNDIARAAGVSQATVSLVLNQSRNIQRQQLMVARQTLQQTREINRKLPVPPVFPAANP